MKDMIRKKKNAFGIALVILILLSGCKNQARPDHKINRFDQDLFSLTLAKDHGDLNSLKAKYPLFFPLFCSEIIGIGPDTASGAAEFINQFLTDPVILSVKETTDSVYPDLHDIAENIHMGIDRFGDITSRNDTVKLIFYISGFNQSFVSLPGILAVGLDNYLGSDAIYYQNLAIPKYIRKTMDPEFIVVDAVRAWIMSEIEPSGMINTLLDHMIHEGKILYLLNESFPTKEMNKVFRYSREQLEWCEENERSMWEFIIENELLYSSDRLLISRLTKEAPFIREFGPESPGRAGSWLGFRIVQRFMQKTSISASELIKIEDTKTILSESRYRPG